MTCDVCGNELFEGALFCGECGSSVYPQKIVDHPQPSDTQVIPRFFFDAEDEVRADDVAPDESLVLESDLVALMIEPTVEPEPEPVVAASTESDSVPDETFFTLSLSSGESLEVSTNGLIGRMPEPGAGETFGHLVIVVDPERSVSKTHLEFGCDGDQLWVLDRHSGNGSVIRESGKIPRRAEPGRRYVVARGTRIDMGKKYVLID